MMEQQNMDSLPRAPVSRLAFLGHRIPGDQGHHVEKNRSFSKSLRPKQKNYIGTLNVNTLTKIGKLKQLITSLNKFKIKVIALQETRFNDESHFNSDNYRIYKGKPATKNSIGATQFGTAFAVHSSILDSVIDFSSTSEKLSLLSLKSANKAYTLINVHAPTNDYNRKSPQKAEEFWENLEETTSKIPKHHVKILLGDFNAQIGCEKKFRKTTGSHTAHKRTNKNGERLINFCKSFNLKIMSTQFKKPKQKLYTWKSPNRKLGEFQIDHVAISATSTKEILNVKMRQGFFESDHHLLQVKVKFQPNRKRKQIPKLLRPDPEYIKINKEKILTKINEETNTDWARLAKKIQETIALGQPPRRRKHRWWNKTCDQAMEERIQAWKNFSGNRTDEKWHYFHTIQKKSSKIIRKEKRNYDKKRLEELEQDFARNNTRKFYKVFKENIVGYQAPNLCFKRPDGTLETNTKNNNQILAEYFNNLLNCDPPTDKLLFNTPKYQHPESKAPLINEIIESINSLKNNKAPGEDGIIAELWKLKDQNLTKKIHQIIKDIWKTERIPDEWKCALIHPLHKKGDKTDVNNYRGISILPVTYKILSKCLLNRIEAQADPQIGEYQAGFRKGRSCIEQIWNLKMILQTRKVRNTVVTFIDFKKAYDSIDRQTLFDILDEFGIDRKTKEITRQTLLGTTSKVKFMGDISESFEVKTGVRQGDGLSPILFNIVLEKIISEWERHTEGIQLGIKKANRIKVKCLAFADDIAILTNNRKEAQSAVEKLHEIAQKTGLRISYEKTQYLERFPENKLPLRTKYGKIIQVTQFKYLGEIIQSSGLNSSANQDRSSKLLKAYRITWNHYNKKSVSVNAKLRHYKTVILPEALYAAETTVLRGHTKINEIEKQERKILRKIYGPLKQDGIWIRRPRSELYHHTQTITEEIRRRRVKFYGHIHRMNPDRLTKRIFDVIKSSKGKTSWLKETENDLEQLKITEHEIGDRNNYRNRIMTSKFEQHPQTTEGKKWSEERKLAHSARMKRFWEEKRIQNK